MYFTIIAPIMKQTKNDAGQGKITSRPLHTTLL